MGILIQNICQMRVYTALRLRSLVFERQLVSTVSGEEGDQQLLQLL